MTISTSVFLIAVGAILRFATNLHLAHVEIDTVGLILIGAGIVGLVLGLVLEVSDYRARRKVLVEDRHRRLPPQH